ncbi:MAG: 1-acyl-sn-glycerol-3-phosphate acyltransferase [Candidatus Aminicenantes bacterium]|nr:1-acyl-sn-glycerol-3-phosphate acyltransferase [Candidatus Aminicenantes bacterium]
MPRGYTKKATSSCRLPFAKAAVGDIIALVKYKMKRESQPAVTRRSPLLYGSAVLLLRLGLRFLSRTHEEIPSSLFMMQRQGYRFLYVGLHKSLWETSGVQTVLHRNRLTVPYAAMGDNLVHGRFFQAIAKKLGIFLVKRAVGREGLLESAASLKREIQAHLRERIDVLVFPEGTRKNIPQHGRYGTFFTTVFEAALELSQEGEKVLLVPVNVDYSHVREDHEMLGAKERHPRTLHILDSLNMLSHLDDIFVSIGDPIVPGDRQWNRKDLAAHCHRACLDLIKILPINIVAWAIHSLLQKNERDAGSLYREIEANIMALSPFHERFRGFGLSCQGQVLFETVAGKRKEFRLWAEKKPEPLALFKLYRDYIGHLIPVETHPA